jgi:hypothetical protein
MGKHICYPTLSSYDCHELAWAAGFADGEAWFGTAKRGRGYWRLHITIGQKHREPLDRFRAAVQAGGVYGPYRRSPGFWTYAASAAQARRVVSLLTPYLSAIKLEQIDVARVRCADMNEIRGIRPHPSKRTHCPQGHPDNEANTRHYRNTRVCRECCAQRGRLKRQERRLG